MYFEPNLFVENENQKPQPQPEPEPQPERRVYCDICYLEFLNSEMCKLDCGHSFCSPCLKSTINMTLSNGNNRLGCPGCSSEFSEKLIVELAGEEALKKMKRFKILAANRNNPSAVWCPQASCGLPCVKKAETDQFVACECGFDFCVKCSLANHEGKTCKQAFDSLPVEERQRRKSRSRKQTIATIGSKFWAFWNTKPCPKCEEPIEKNGGCHHMHCYRCNFNFCWNCGMDYNKKHCIGRKAVLLVALPVTVPTGVALAPVVGLTALSVFAGEQAALSLGWEGIKDRYGYRKSLLERCASVGWHTLGAKHFVEPLFDGW
eukprot:TRINITY_DN6906_c0_g1_i1.p1 TRINITY_DN6906_c0_g1~~TRINITY_DN6906_c0_g1_i1.p1  ORF type:complete len:334 (+),score=57.30 TRINITY_DN6906_c0_g1_i1:46-1002(+)